MNAKHIGMFGWYCLTLAVVCLSGLAWSAEVNNGDVVYAYDAVPSTMHTSPDGYVNYGTVTAIGGNIHSVAPYSVALTISSGDFINHGQVTATGGDQKEAVGIFVTSGGFTNNGLVVAKGGEISSAGIVVNKGFVNHGYVTAINGVGVSGNGLFLLQDNGFSILGCWPWLESKTAVLCFWNEIPTYTSLLTLFWR